MTEKARTYAIVLYELGIPGQMVEGAVSIFKESPQLVRTLKSPVVPVKNKHAILGKIFREPGFSGLMVNFLKKACDAGASGRWKILQMHGGHIPLGKRESWRRNFIM